MTWLLRLYPRGWQRRYGAEVATLLETEKFSARLALDLIAGAIDARLNPHLATKGAPMSVLLRGCHPVGATRADVVKSNVTLFGGTLLLAVAYIYLRVRIPAAKPYLDTLVYGGFPLSLVMSSYWTYLKPYSPRVRVVLMLATSLIVLAILFAATTLANRL
jgi:hypothetical protein